MSLGLTSGVLRAQDSTVSVMPLGDSLTEGYSSYISNTYTPGGYRDPLYSLLLNSGIQTTYVGASNENPSSTLSAAGQTAQNGYNGYTIGQIAGNLAGSDPLPSTYSNHGGYWLSGNPATGQAPETANIILLMIGTNDVTNHIDPLYTGSGAETTSVFASDTASRIVSLAQDIRQYEPNALILVAGPPPANGFDTIIEPINLDLQSDITAGQAGTNVDYVNMFTPFWTNSNWANGAINWNYYNGVNGATTDGIHMNPTGYDLMAQTWYNAIMADYNFNADPATVPEPSTYALFIGGAVVLFAWRRWRRA